MTRLTIGLGIAVMIFILLCTVACGGSDGSLAKGGLNLVVVSGQGRIQSGGGNASVEEGQEAVITVGDQIAAGEAGVKLLLANGSLLYLSPGTDLQVTTFSAEGTVRLSQLKGRLEVEAASPLLTVEISILTYDKFATQTMQFTATPAVRDTTFRLWIDGVNVHLTVEDGEVKVTRDDSLAIIPTGGEVKAILGGELIVSQTGATATPTSTPSVLTHPSPTVTATPTPAPDFLYPAPGLLGPADGSEFKGDETILLIWGIPTPLSEDEWCEVQLWKEGEVPYTVVQRTKEGTWKVEPKYYPGRYQWRILIVRGQEGHKEMDLSWPSQTWSFGWLRPPVQTPTATTNPPLSEVPVDVTVYLRGTNNAQGFAPFRGEHVNAGTIYAEGGYIYGNVAVQIGDKVYHSDEELAPGGPKPLPDPWRVEFEFAETLAARTGDKAGFDPKKAQFWVGTLDDDSAVGEENPYSLTMNLYEGNRLWKSIQVFFTVADVSEPGGGGEPGEHGLPTRPPRP